MNLIRKDPRDSLFGVISQLRDYIKVDKISYQLAAGFAKQVNSKHCRRSNKSEHPPSGIWKLVFQDLLDQLPSTQQKFQSGDDSLLIKIIPKNLKSSFSAIN